MVRKKKMKNDFFERLKNDIETFSHLKNEIESNLDEAFRWLGKELVIAKKKNIDMILPEKLNSLVELLIPFVILEESRERKKRTKKEQALVPKTDLKNPVTHPDKENNTQKENEG